jgi:type IV secretion system protein VirB11
LAIRSLTADQRITFKDYGLTPDAELPGMARLFDGFEIKGDHIAQIAEVIRRHMSIVVSGATSTGKTTFTNQLIRMIDETARVITVEDAREVTVPHWNRVHLMVPRNRSVNAVDYNTIIDSLMRLTPDWVICGEVSVSNAAPLYSLMGKGHPVITTVHAGTPEEAIQAFVNNMATAGSSLDPSTTANNLRRQIGCLIQLDRHDGRRKVVDIQFPSRDAQRRDYEAARQQ